MENSKENMHFHIRAPKGLINGLFSFAGFYTNNTTFLVCSVSPYNPTDIRGYDEILL